jgi:hypothetical protein
MPMTISQSPVAPRTRVDELAVVMGGYLRKRRPLVTAIDRPTR